MTDLTVKTNETNIMHSEVRSGHGLATEPLQPDILTEADICKTYYNEKEGILGCPHYRRGAKLQCGTCGQWATCHYCHDEREDHRLVRYSTNQC